MSRIWSLVSVTVFMGSIVGCYADTARSDDGRIDLVIRPDSTASSSRPVRGSFTLRSLERRSFERIPIESPYQTLSIPLRAGSYTLGWEPELAFEANGDALSAARLALASAGVRSPPIAILAGQVTRVNVRASLGSSVAPERTALAMAAPCVEGRVAQH
jgi:hypothetical protein